MDESSFNQAPLTADGLEISPISPSNDSSPVVSGITSASAVVKLYSKPNCSGIFLGEAKASSSGSFSITSSVLKDGVYDLSVMASSSSGGSTCSVSTVAYIVDTTAPVYTVSAPSAGLVNSASPAVTYSLDYIRTATVNLVSSKVLLNASGTASCQIAIADGTTHTPTVSLSSCTGNGTINMSIDSGTAADDVGNLAGVETSKGVVYVDNSGPNSAVYDPVTGTYDAIPVSVSITFPEVIDGTSVASTDFSVTGTCATLPNVNVISAVGSIVTLGLTGASCGLGETVILTTDLTGIADPTGNPGSGSASVTYTYDNVGPTSAVFNPATSRVSVIPATISLDFSEAVTASSLTGSDFVISGTCGTLPALSVSDVTGDLATLALSGAVCSVDQTLTLSIDLANVTDTTNNAGSGSASVTYTFDDVGPVASLINPATSSVASIPASVTVSFSENLLMSSVTDTDLVVSGTCGTLPTAGLSGVAGTDAIFTLTGAVCSSGQTVVVTMNGVDVTDEAGNIGTGSISATYTFDDAGPVPTSTSPVSGTVNALPTAITFNFDEPLLASSVDATDVVVSGTCGTLPIVSLTGVSVSSAVFDLSGAVCSNGETTVLTMNGVDVTDEALNAGSGSASVTFTVDSAGPSPSSISPASANTAVMPTTVTVNFDESVLASSVTAADLVISGTCTALPSASLVSVSGAVVTFSLSAANCVDSQTLTLSVNGADVADTLGNAGSNNQSVTYIKDTTGPSVISFSPATGAVMTIPNLVSITFDEAVLAGSVAAADFTVSGTCNVLPIHSVSGVSGQQVFISLSGAVCDHNQTAVLTVNASGINDTAGNAGAGAPSVSYTVDIVGPSVSSFTPNNGAPPVAVSIAFTENLNPATVSLSDFVLSGSCQTQNLSITNVVNNVVDLDLSGTSCLSGETLTITINAADVSDAVGNAGAGTSFVTFTQP